MHLQLTASGNTSTGILTNGQSNLKQMRIAAAHGSFNSIRQVAPTYTPSNNGLLSPDESALPKGICISIGSSVFAELTSPAPRTGGQTHRPQ